MPFSSWQFRCITIQFPATPLLCISMLVHCDSFQLIASTLLFCSIPCPCVSFPDLSLLFLRLSALHFSIAVHFISLPTHYISWLCLCFFKPSYTFSFLRFSWPLHAFATLGNSMPLPNLTFPLQCISFLFLSHSMLINAVTFHSVAFPLHCISIPQPCDSNQCHYLKIVVGLWLISCQTKAPLPELRHCPRPLNRP